MKKVSFGSFPLTEIKKEDRKCLDKYLIKTFADNISISDAIRNLAITKDMMYITPDALMRDWMGTKQQRVNKTDRESNSMYEAALKRAFYVMKEFYSTVSVSPFYKEYVYYPIYIEKIERVSSEGNSDYDVKYTDVTMNYSFIILSNDLTKNLKIDEIRYDENASLNFLFLFIEFFSGGASNQSIHDFGKRDYEFLIKLYQFIEKSNKEPIQMVLDLYKLIALIKEMQGARNDSDKNELVGKMNKFLNGVKVDDLKKYSGLLRHKFITMIDGGSAVGGDALRANFEDLMNTIFKSEGLSGMYDGVDTKASRGERHSYLYSNNKYREVLALAGELVKYNELRCNQVISDDRLEMDFKIENNNRTLDIKSGMAAQKYQTFFKDYVDSIRQFFDGMIQDLLSKLNVDTKMTTTVKKIADEIEVQLKTLEAELAKIEKTVSAREYQLKNIIKNGADQDAIDKQYQVIMDITQERDIKQVEVDQQRTFSANLKNQQQDIINSSKTIPKEVSKELVDYLVSSMVTNLTFVYDDGKRFFTNQLVAQGLIDLHKDTLPTGTPSDHDLTTSSGFEKAAKNHSTTSYFPPTLVDKNNDVNPAYLAANVASSLDDSFEVMAGDVLESFKQSVIPTLQKHFQASIFRSANIADPGAGPVLVPRPGKAPRDPKSKDPKIQAKYVKDLAYWKTLDNKYTDYVARKKMYDAKLALFKNSSAEFKIFSNFLGEMEALDIGAHTDPIKDELHQHIFRDRFINKVLKNFLRLFRERETSQVIEHDEQISQLHPLIKKLLDRGDQCQFFKSFIIEQDMVEQLYRLKYITDTQKFLDGITRLPPKKFNDPMSRMQTVLYDYLHLENNPTWVISQANVFLSMPDDLSLTGTSILSNIPKADLMEVCRINPKDYWQGDNMGEATKLGNSSPQVKKLVKDIARLEDEVESLKKEDSVALGFNESVELQILENEKSAQLLEEGNRNNNTRNNNTRNNNNNNNNRKKSNTNQKKSNKNDWKNKGTYNQKQITAKQKEISRKEEQLAKAMTDYKDKDFLPNMSIFDDPYRAEKQEFLSDQEKSELVGNRNKMEEKIRNLNPYDDADVREMEDNQKEMDAREREQRTHPFDFEEGKEGRVEGPQRWENISSRETENEDWVQNGERSKNNEFTDSQDEHGYDNRDRWRR